jgi:two-component system, NarL family, invasion response regulator UvrY
LSAEQINLLVVDDHRLVRKGIVSLLKSAGGFNVVAEAGDGEEAIQLCKKHSPDVVLMDLQMPGIGGLEATKKLLRLFPTVKVLALTVCDSDLFPARFLEEGASGYITKDCNFDEIAQAIKTVQAGQRYISPKIAQKLALRRYTKSDASPFDCLSERELQVMMMITKGQKAQEIAQILHLSPKTVNTYRYRIFDKLGINSDVDLTHLALRYGVISSE